MSDYQFRAATPADDPALLALYEAAFGKGFSPEWWAWYFACPTGRDRVAVAELDGQLAGAYGLLPYRLWLNGREVAASLCQNVCTHPDHQGRGLFVRLGHHALDAEGARGVSVCLGMPNSKALPGHLKVGWDEAAPLPFLVKEHDAIRPRRNRCVEVDAFDPRVDALMERIRERFAFLVLKDHAFLNWRFRARPGQQYAIHQVEDGDLVRGYVVLKRFDDGDRRKAHILDLHAEDEGALAELLAAAEEHACLSHELNGWTNPLDPYREQMLAAGFVERASADRLIVYWNAGAAPEPFDGGAVWFCLSDNDVY